MPTRTRVYADLNPAYPSKGERRWGVFLRDGRAIERLEGLSFTARKSAERAACRLQVETALAALGIVVDTTKESNQCKR
jgi:hypothetical protein